MKHETKKYLETLTNFGRGKKPPHGQLVPNYKLGEPGSTCRECVHFSNPDRSSGDEGELGYCAKFEDSVHEDYTCPQYASPENFSNMEYKMRINPKFKEFVNEKLDKEGFGPAKWVGFDLVTYRGEATKILSILQEAGVKISDDKPLSPKERKEADKRMKELKARLSSETGSEKEEIEDEISFLKEELNKK